MTWWGTPVCSLWSRCSQTRSLGQGTWRCLELPGMGGFSLSGLPGPAWVAPILAGAPWQRSQERMRVPVLGCAQLQRHPGKGTAVRQAPLHTRSSGPAEWATGHWQPRPRGSPSGRRRGGELPGGLWPPLAPPCPCAGRAPQPTRCQQPLIFPPQEVEPGQGIGPGRQPRSAAGDGDAALRRRSI